jgi:transposase
MIGLPRGVTVYAFDEPCDMRKSFDTLTALVTQRMGRQVLTGDLFLFIGRDRPRAKALALGPEKLIPGGTRLTSR